MKIFGLVLVALCIAAAYAIGRDLERERMRETNDRMDKLIHGAGGVV